MPLSPIVIAIVVMVVVVLGAVGFLVFTSSSDDKEEEEETTVTVSGADAASCNKLGYYSNTSPASESTCKTFIDTATSGMNKNPESFYDEKWCKSTYSTLSTTSAFCKAAATNLDTYVKSLATMFDSIRLIKASQGTSVTYYYDSTSTTSNPSPSTLKVDAIETTGTNAYKRTANIKSVDGVLALFKSAGSSKVGWQLETYVIEHVATSLGIVTNSETVSWDSSGGGAYKKGATPLTGTSIRNYTVLPSVWKTIGPGANFTYSYLNLTTENQEDLLNALKGDVGGFAKYCA